MRRKARALSVASGALVAVTLVLATVHCGSPDAAGSAQATAAAHGPTVTAQESAAVSRVAVLPGAAAVSPEAAAAAWDVVYGVLQHPRCANCHPAGNVPLQGDALLPHAQNVQRGPSGNGLYALRCDACHQTGNLAGAHLPPGAPHWQLPRPDVPLVFVGRSKRELCEQLRDPARNGGKTPEQLFEHVAHDPLVLWGWDPGEGRAPVSTPHDEVVRAMRTWVDSGCACPE